MKALSFLALLAAVQPCNAKPSDGLDAGASSATDATAPDGSAPASATGTGCAQDANAGVTLCTATSLCPGLTVDHDLFPHCGFVMQGNALTLGCDCDGALCSMGIAATCAQARSLLTDQSEAAVCAQVGEGRCTGGATKPPSGGTCDQSCYASCAGDPGCIRLCGC